MDPVNLDGLSREQYSEPAIARVANGTNDLFYEVFSAGRTGNTENMSESASRSMGCHLSRGHFFLQFTIKAPSAILVRNFMIVVVTHIYFFHQFLKPEFRAVCAYAVPASDVFE